MKQHKLISRLSLLVIVGLVFTACQTNISPAPPAEKIHLRWFIGVGTGKSPKQLAVTRVFIEQFNATHPDIELEMEVVSTSTHDAVDQLLAAIAAGTAPDIVGPDGSWGIYQYASSLLALDPMLGTLDQSDFDPQDLNYWQTSGATIGFPLGSIPSFIYYKKSLFDAAQLPYPPHQFGAAYADGDAWTVEKMEALAMQLTLDVDGHTALESTFNPDQCWQWGFHWQWDSTRSMAVMFGPGSVLGDNQQAIIPENWREAFRWYYAGMWDKHFIPTGAQVYRMQGNPFYSGQVAMVNSFLWYAPRLAGFSGWDIAAVPAYQGRITTRAERNGLVILNTTAHPSEAFKVVVAIAHSPELLSAWGIIPAYRSLRPVYLEELKSQWPGVDWQVAFDSLEYADAAYEDTMPNYRQAYDRLLEFRDAMANDSHLDLETTMDQLALDLQTIFAGSQK